MTRSATRQGRRASRWSEPSARWGWPRASSTSPSAAASSVCLPSSRVRSAPPRRSPIWCAPSRWASSCCALPTRAAASRSREGRTPTSARRSGRTPGFCRACCCGCAGTFATAAVSTVLASSIGQLVPRLSGPAMEMAILVVGVRVLVAGQPARRHPRRPAQHRRHGRQAAAAARGGDWRRVLHRSRQPADRGAAGRPPTWPARRCC